MIDRSEFATRGDWCVATGASKEQEKKSVRRRGRWRTESQFQP